MPNTSNGWNVIDYPVLLALTFRLVLQLPLQVGSPQLVQLVVGCGTRVGFGLKKLPMLVLLFSLFLYSQSFVFIAVVKGALMAKNNNNNNAKRSVFSIWRSRPLCFTFERPETH